MGRGPPGARDHQRRRAGHAGRRRAGGRGAGRGRARPPRSGSGPAGPSRSWPSSSPPAAAARTAGHARSWPRRSGRLRRSPLAAVLRSAGCRPTSGTTPRSTGRGRPVGGPGAGRPATGPAVRVLVTGASGMLGRGDRPGPGRAGRRVTVLQRRPAGLGLPEVLADVADARGRRPCRGWPGRRGPPRRQGRRRRPWPEYAAANVDGTRAVVDACRAAGVGRLVHVSSPSVAHAGSLAGRRRRGAGRPGRARGPLRAEQGRGRAARAGRRRTRRWPCSAVRPHLVWGPGDTQLVGRDRRAGPRRAAGRWSGPAPR